MDIQEKNLIRILSLPIKNEGYKLLEVKFFGNGPENIIQLVIYNDQGVDIEDCVKIHDIANEIITNYAQINENFTLEVSSPGIFKELKKPEHFKIFKGKRIKIKLKQKIQGISTALGEISDSSLEGINLNIENINKTIIIPFSLISKANLEPLI